MEDFILKIPKWEGEIVFSQELITLIVVIVALITGVLLCFWGYRYFKTIALILLGCICGIIGYRIGEGMTSNLVLQMCIFIMFTFLGVCIFYLLSMVWVWFLDKLKIRAFVQRTLHIIASLTGALLVGLITYFMVFQNVIVAVIIAGILAIAGVCYGIRNVKARRVFRTYDDLKKLEPLTEDEINA